MKGGRIASALVAGLTFGVGLSVSGMLDPRRVQGFIDVFGAWDPTLALVLGPAVLVTFMAVQVASRWRRPLLDEAFDLPERRPVDRRLLAGSALFGIGWGLAGFCPGPGLAAMAMGLWQPALFVAAMLAGMVIHERALSRHVR